MIRRAGIALVVILWLGAMFALGLSAQERRATWVVNATDAPHVDSLRAAVASLGGTSDRPDVTFYRIRGSYASLRDSLFVYADSNRDAPVGRRVAVTGPWKRWVRYVELDGVVEVPRDSTSEGAAPLEAVFWFQSLHGAGHACAMGACGKNVKVGAADTGLDRFHPEFAGRLLYGKNYGGLGFGGTSDTTDFSDAVPGCNGHGTHVESSLGGATMGGARDATLVFYRVMEPTSCTAFSSTTTKALLDATRNLVDVMNVSIGHTYSYAMGQALLERKAAGLVTCGASGNDGTGPVIFWPGGDSSAVGASAVDAAGVRASFARWGPALDFAGAGVGVRGASPGGGYVDKSGTSMGSPWTCAMFAQVLSTPEFQAMPKTKARVDSAQTLLCLSATFKPVGGRDDYMGCGVPNAARAIAMMRGGVEVAASKTDTMTVAAAVQVCKPIVSTAPWKATTSTPWITLSSTQDELCYTTIPALMPAGGGNAVVRVERDGVIAPPPPPVTGPTVTVDVGTHYQTMDMWETSLRMWEQDKINDRFAASIETYSTAVANYLVDSVGINGVRVQIQSGLENPVDYWTPFVTGTMSYTVWSPSRYEKVNDNANPNVANLAGFQFAPFDYQMEKFVLPMKARLAARGESLHVNLNYLDFKWNAARQGTLSHANNPAEFAELVLVFFERMRDRYGIVPDAFEVILEPENTTSWDGGAIGRGAVAVAARLAAAGFHPKFIVPSMTNMGNAVPTFNAVMAVPGTAGVISMLAYHRYGGESEANAALIRTTAASKGIKTGMLEKVGAGIDEWMEDVTVANASAWQQWGMADESGHDDAGAYYARVVLGQPPTTAISLAGRTRLLAPVFRAVRRGATRVASTATELKTAAFVNTDGRVVAVLRPRGAGAVTLLGLPMGRYEITFAPESGTTIITTTTGNGPLPVTFAGAGVLVVRGIP